MTIFVLLWLTYLKFIQIGGNCRDVILASQTDRQTKSFELTLRPQLVKSASFGQLFIIIPNTFHPNVPSQGEMKKVLPHYSFQAKFCSNFIIGRKLPEHYQIQQQPLSFTLGMKMFKAKTNVDNNLRSTLKCLSF